MAEVNKVGKEKRKALIILCMISLLGCLTYGLMARIGPPGSVFSPPTTPFPACPHTSEFKLKLLQNAGADIGVAELPSSSLMAFFSGQNQLWVPVEYIAVQIKVAKQM